jgi:hypothetical protein
MKFELVDFYPVSKKAPPKNKNMLGTVHVYSIDNNMDFRGIAVFQRKKLIIFYLPNGIGFDDETGKKVHYPLYSFTNHDHHKALLDFLHDEVKPAILERLKDQK